MIQEPFQTLIVGDDEDQRVLLTHVLQGRSQEVVACATASEGLAAYQRNQFPLVILDLMRDALREPLTDLPNRQLFFERLDRAARRHAR